MNKRWGFSKIIWAICVNILLLRWVLTLVKNASQNCRGIQNKFLTSCGRASLAHFLQCHKVMFWVACARTIISAFCQILGKVSLFSASYQLLLVLLNDHLVCCKNWKHTWEVPGIKTVSAIWHYYILNVLTVTEKVIASSFYKQIVFILNLVKKENLWILPLSKKILASAANKNLQLILFAHSILLSRYL